MLRPSMYGNVSACEVCNELLCAYMIFGYGTPATIAKA